MSSLYSIVSLPAVILSTVAVTSLAGDLEAANVAADAVHSNGKTAIMQAARAGDESAVERLIEIGADINRTNNNGGTPLMYAVLGGNVDIVRTFVQMGVDLDAMAKNGWSALMIAAAKGRAESVKILLNHSADPNLSDIYGWTPLMRSVYENRVVTARLLMKDSRTRLDHRGENGVTALHIATARGHVNLAEMLLDNGADSSLQDEVGRTPYQIALKNNDPELLALLKGD